MSKKYLLGATKDGEIVFTEFEVTHRNGYPEFSASFDTVKPFTEDEVDATEYYESLVDEMDKEWKYDQCERLNCSPDGLAEALQEEGGDDPQEIKDCSVYPETIKVNDTDYYFESCSGGQHDTREDMDEYTNKPDYDRIHALWDKWHLKKVPDGVIAEVNDIQNRLGAIKKEDWISDYIERTL